MARGKPITRRARSEALRITRVSFEPAKRRTKRRRTINEQTKMKQGDRGNQTVNEKEYRHKRTKIRRIRGVVRAGHRLPAFPLRAQPQQQRQIWNRPSVSAICLAASYLCSSSLQHSAAGTGQGAAPVERTTRHRLGVALLRSPLLYALHCGYWRFPARTVKPKPRCLLQQQQRKD